MKTAILIVLSMVSVLLVGCNSARVKTGVPKSFAVDKKIKGKGILLAAVEPEGTVYRVRKVEPKQDGSFEFWSEALSKHLTENGYVKVSESDITVSGVKGQQYEYNVPVGAKDYIYQVAMIPNQGDLIVVEASGDRKRFDQLRSEVDKAIQDLEIK
ncbi:MAG: hypothetical protein AAF202_00740 [Pseudomonadota bacterium]